MSAGTLFRLLAPLLALLALCLVLRARGESLREIFALVPTRLPVLVRWIAGFVVLLAVEAALERIFRLPRAQPWGDRYGATERLFRLLGTVAAAPVAEELIFRGAVFTRLARTVLEAPGAIAVTAAMFAVLHLQYGPRQMSLILADGLFYGLARAKTGSVLVPLTCHMIGNAYAAWERLAG
jgi:membrane protease YdiL (CAAX protease family)